MFYSCDSSQSNEILVDQNEEHQMSHSGLIELTEIQMEKIGLRTSKIDSQVLANTKAFNGFVAAHPAYRFDITSLINGRVADIRVLPGQKVSKGELLMSLENADIVEWQREYITHLNEFRFTEAEYKRQKKLYEDNVTAAREFQQIEADFNILLGDLKTLKAKLEMIGLDPAAVASGHIAQKLPIRSPLNGYVDDLNVNNGAFVQNFESLTTVIDPNYLHVEINVFEQDLQHLSVGAPLIFTTQSGEEQYEAKVFSIGKIIDPQTRTVLIHADIVGKHQLSEGMYVQAKAITNQALSPCLPSDAIVADQGLNYVFVKDQPTDLGSLFRKVPVIAGASEMGFTAIDPLEPVRAH
jgi:cobalt-zinc-cadmium efflux system membrane fusion protein